MTRSEEKIMANIERMNTRIGRGVHVFAERQTGRCDLHHGSPTLVVDIEIGEHAYVCVYVCVECAQILGGVR